MTGIGLIYVFANKFMPFHSDVIQTKWEDVDALSQILYLGMMRTEGAGFLATATAMSILLFIPFMKNQQWSYWALSVVGIVEYLPTLFANYHVATVTSASPPWPLMLTLTISLVAALSFAIFGNITKQEQTL